MVNMFEIGDKVRSTENPTTVYTISSIDDVYITVVTDCGSIYKNYHKKYFYLDRKTYRVKVINNILL